MSSTGSRVLVIGATGGLGRHVVQASLACNCPTYAYVRPSAVNDPGKATLLHSFQSAGAILLQGSLEAHDSLVEAIKQADIVVSCVDPANYLSELKILTGIQEVGTIKRFVLFDYVAAHSVEFYGALKSAIEARDKVMTTVMGSGVPFTCIVMYGFASYYLASLGQLDSRAPPTDKVLIAGDGDLKAFMVSEEDIGMYAIKAALDSRAENKNVHLKLPKNHLSQNEMVSVWESKTGKTLERVYESEEDMRKSFQDGSGATFTRLLKHFTFAKGGHNQPLNNSNEVEVLELFPEVEYINADRYLDRFVK
ncbi:hypothetical protein GOP47_0017869 [Adiantum capillus-veneris]|uniref:NmrA-like domain-containing protein n=2 Tax=Adiantum capillus-veneris TaxID=13818 RepID=A0A9D4UG81_ADICA|nr:hypothetical protein GOP47_0017869 [Adiantum capillus-veneris]